MSAPTAVAAAMTPAELEAKIEAELDLDGDGDDAAELVNADDDFEKLLDGEDGA